RAYTGRRADRCGSGSRGAPQGRQDARAAHQRSGRTCPLPFRVRSSTTSSTVGDHRPSSLLVALDDLRVADTRGVCFVACLTERSTLAKQIPGLVETDLDRLEPAGLAVVQATLRSAFVQLVFLGNELLDLVVELLVLHYRTS